MSYESLRGDPDVMHWISGVFDMCGSITMDMRGERERTRLRIFLPRMWTGSILKALFGGTVYKSRQMFPGRHWTWEITSKEDLKAFILVVQPRCRVMQTPLRLTYLYLQGSSDFTETQKLLNDWYSVYHHTWETEDETSNTRRSQEA